jgi:hypothetical protein
LAIVSNCIAEIGRRHSSKQGLPRQQTITVLATGLKVESNFYDFFIIRAQMLKIFTAVLAASEIVTKAVYRSKFWGTATENQFSSLNFLYRTSGVVDLNLLLFSH